MAPKPEDDWSDSDDEVGSDVETAVQLGIPDGPVESSADLLDATVSRIGGHPVRLLPPYMYLSHIELNPVLSRMNMSGFLDFACTHY